MMRYKKGKVRNVIIICIVVLAVIILRILIYNNYSKVMMSPIICADADVNYKSDGKVDIGTYEYQG